MKRSPAVAAGLVICTLLGVPRHRRHGRARHSQCPACPCPPGWWRPGHYHRGRSGASVPRPPRKRERAARAIRGQRHRDRPRTGDILRQTPNAMAATAAVICPALGGSPRRL